MKLRSTGPLAILISTIVASILSMTVDMTGYELGAIFNLVIPPFVGALAIILYLLTDWLSKSKEVKILVLVSCCIYVLYVGFFFHYNDGYLPFPFD